MTTPIPYPQWLWMKQHHRRTSNMEFIELNVPSAPWEEPPWEQENEENQLAPIQKVRMRIQYKWYVLCTTLSKGICWLLFILAILLIFAVITLLVFLRIQWKHSIQAPGPIISWNSTDNFIHNVTIRNRRARRSLQGDDHVQFISTPLSQGIYLQPYPAPILSKERVLAFSHLIMIDVDAIIQELDLYAEKSKTLLKEMIDEELRKLQTTTLNYDIPISDPEDQKSYIEHKCYQEFAHCYYIKYNTVRNWPTSEIIQDICPLPSISPNVKPRVQAVWDYYLKPPKTVPQNWTLYTDFNGSRPYAYKYPGIQNATGMVFCTNQIYSSDWYSDRISPKDMRHILQTLLNNLTMFNSSQMINKTLPYEWNTEGEGTFFKTLKQYQYCMLPEAVAFLNTTYYSWSLFEGDCNITQDNYTNQCKDCKRRDPSQHPYRCKVWRRQQNEQIQCENEDKSACKYIPPFLEEEVQTDLGVLAYNKYFENCPCIKRQTIQEPTYTVYSITKECQLKAEKYDYQDVIITLRKFLGFGTQDYVKTIGSRRAFRQTTEELLTLNYNVKQIKSKTTNCISTTYRRRSKRSTDNNYSKIQQAGLSMTKAISIVSKISDLNDQALAQGIHLLKDHVLTLMEATMHDITILGEVARLQWLHIHLSSMVQTLLNGKIPWEILSYGDWIQAQLNITDAEMNIARKLGTTLLYNIQKEGTRWDLEVYCEIILPHEVYTRNWEVVNIGHLVRTGTELSHVKIQHPYTIVNQDCIEVKYLKIKNCVLMEYLICDEIIQVEPCGNTTGSNCPVISINEDKEVFEITTLKNGSYIILSSLTDCGLSPYEPHLVTVNATVTCYGVTLRAPLTQEETSTEFQGHVPDIHLQLPHLTGVITKIRGIEIHLTSTWDTIKEQINRAEDLLLRLDLHEGDFPQWLNRVASSLQDIWPSVSEGLKSLSDFVSNTAGGLFNNIFGIISYIKPIIIFTIFIVILLLFIKLISWLHNSKKKES